MLEDLEVVWEKCSTLGLAVSRMAHTQPLLELKSCSSFFVQSLKFVHGAVSE